LIGLNRFPREAAHLIPENPDSDKAGALCDVKFHPPVMV